MFEATLCEMGNRTSTDELAEFQSEEDPSWPVRTTPSPSRTCTICAAPSNGYHFNAASCSACAAFFRRTVTLNRNFVCAQNGNCRVNYAMRVICRACRYVKCITMGMERQAVQPRRDCNVGRRKISYSRSHTASSSAVLPAPPPPAVVLPPTQPHPPRDRLASVVESSGLSPEELNYAPSYSSSISEDMPSPKTETWIPPTSLLVGEGVLDELLREERLYNERRKLLYCGHSSISVLLSTTPINDIPYGPNDIKELTFAGIQKDIRPQILLIYEWMRGWPHFGQLGVHDKKKFLRRCILYHTLLDPAYLTVRLGLPNRFVMFNGMYVGVAEDSKEGWKDENKIISAEMKKQLYRPLLERVVNEIALPMQSIQLTFTEFIFLKALISFKSASVADISAPTKELMSVQIDMLFRSLHTHYSNQGSSQEEIAERTGNLVLLMSSVFAVGMECMESHQKIQFFDLWELDDLLLKLLSREQ